MKNISKITLIISLYGIGVASILGSSEPARTFTYWGKEGATYEQAKTYTAECKYKVGIEKFESRSERDELIEACMEMQGFRHVQYKK